MVLEIFLNKEDVLQYQLYKASKRKSTQKRKTRNRLFISLLMFIMGIYFYIQTKLIIAIIVFLLLALLLFFLYPIYFKYLYKFHFLKHIKENYRDLLGKQGTIEIENDNIILKDNKAESKIKINEIIKVVEISNNYFIEINDINSIILPKNNETEKLINILKENNINIKNELNWKWK
jgi:hypothetical protein